MKRNWIKPGLLSWGILLGAGYVVAKNIFWKGAVAVNFKQRPLIETITLPEDNVAPDFEAGTLQFIGTATMIIRYAGFTILTDPNFTYKGEKVHLGYGITSERLTEPAIRLSDLPAQIDVGFLSHFHEDHFDRRVQKELPRHFPIMAPPSAAKILQGLGFDKALGVAPWQSVIFHKGDATLKMTAMPGKHAPSPIGELLPPVMGSLLEFVRDGETVFTLYISGDTLPLAEMKRIPEVYPDIDLAMLHLGGTRIFGITVTMNDKHGLEVLRLLNPRKAVPIHYNDYTVFKSPLSDFQQTVEAAGESAVVDYVQHGDIYAFHSRLSSPEQIPSLAL